MGILSPNQGEEVAGLIVGSGGIRCRGPIIMEGVGTRQRSPGNELVWSASDQIVNNSTTLVDHNELRVALAANETVVFTAHVRADSATTADFKFGFTVPTGATILFTPFGALRAQEAGTATFASETNTSGGSRNFGGFGAGTPVVHHLTGLVRTGETAGNLQLQFAQVTAEVSDTKVLANSWILVHRV